MAALDAPTEGRIIPEARPHNAADSESLDVWGFRDSGFTVRPNGNVYVTGARYPISGLELPELLPWMRRVLGVALPLDDTHESQYPPAIPPSPPWLLNNASVSARVS